MGIFVISYLHFVSNYVSYVIYVIIVMLIYGFPTALKQSEPWIL